MLQFVGKIHGHEQGNPPNFLSFGRGPQFSGMAGLFGGGTPAPAPAPACEETYGLFPCSTSLGGTIILIFVYGQALLVGESTPSANWPRRALTLANAAKARG